MISFKQLLIDFLLTLTIFSYTTLAYSSSTNWQLSNGGKARIVFAQANDKHTLIQGAIEISLEAGWKTYWQNPGSAGIPPSIILAAKQKSAMVLRLFFPTPKLIASDVGWANIYYNHVLLPFTLAASNSDQLADNIEGTAHIGICNDLCIPIDIPFNISTLHDHEENWQDGALVSTAFAAIPQKANSSFTVTRAYIKNAKLFLTLKHARNGTPPEIFLDSDSFSLDRPQLVKHDATYSLFSVKVLRQAAHGQKQIHYTAVNGNQSICGAFSV